MNAITLLALFIAYACIDLNSGLSSTIIQSDTNDWANDLTFGTSSYAVIIGRQRPVIDLPTEDLIWNKYNNPVNVVNFSKSFYIIGTPIKGVISVRIDEFADIYMNNKSANCHVDYNMNRVLTTNCDITNYLVKGENKLLITATNLGGNVGLHYRLVADSQY